MNKTKEFKLASTEGFIVKEAQDGEGIYIEGYASTPILDRDEEIIPTSSINTRNWEKNPILLYMHDRSKPIGKVTAFEKRPEGFWVTAYISQVVEKTMGVISLIKEGILKAFSIGFRVKDYFIDQDGRLVYKDIELLEVSVVSIPANTDALFSFIKSLKENSQKDESSINNTKGEIETMEQNTKLQEMEETLKKLMKEKEAAEKALREKEEAEKRAKEEAEKATLKQEVKSAKETVEKFAAEVSTISESIKQITEEIKALKEEVETVKEAKPRIEVKSADEKTISAFMDRYKDALIEAQLFGRKFVDTKTFSKLPEQAKSLTIDAQFQTMVHDQILSDIKQKAPLFNLFSVMGSGAKTDIYPFEGTVSASWGSLGTTNYDLSKKIQFDYYKAMAGVEYKYEDEDQAVISWLPKVRNDIVTALAETIDDAIINGDGVITYKGLIKYVEDNDTTAPNSDTNNKLTAADLRAARALMKKYGVNPKEVVILVNSLKYLQLLDDKDELVTVDKAGQLATLINGSVGFVNGSNVLVNDSFDGNDAVSDVGVNHYSAVIFNKTMFAVKAKPVLVEIDKNIQTQNRIIVGSVNVSFIPLVPLNSGALPGDYPIVAAVKN